MPDIFLAPPATLQQRSRIRLPAPGLVTSLVVHALALAWLWQSSPPRLAGSDATPNREITLRLLPPVAKAPPAVAPRASLPPPLSSRHARAPATSPQPAPPGAPPRIAMPAAPTVPDEPAGVATADTPRFDLAAARATARLVTREERRGVVARSGRQPADEPYTDQRTGERFESARRADCKTVRSESMNLLANVVLLAKDIVTNAANDSGCKW